MCFIVLFWKLKYISYDDFAQTLCESLSLTFLMEWHLIYGNAELDANKFNEKQINFFWNFQGFSFISRLGLLLKMNIFHKLLFSKKSIFQIAYLFFLLLYAYVLVVKLESSFHVTEGILIGWVATLFVEEIRQVRSYIASIVRIYLYTNLHYFCFKIVSDQESLARLHLLFLDLTRTLRLLLS